jgi:hypothetical protein
MRSKLCCYPKTLPIFISMFTVFLLTPAFSATAQDGLLGKSFSDSERGQFRYLWDSVHKSLIFVRDSEQAPSPTIRVYHDTDTPTSIVPLNDFPGAVGVDFWGLSGSPQGGVITAATLAYGNKKLKDLLLTYDQKGKLTKVWDTFPYHLHNLAVDVQSNVYGFGDRSDKSDDDADGDYALIVAYSPQGKVLWESLPRSSFPWGNDMMSGARNNSENQLMVSDRGLFLFVASTEELFHFDLSGKQLGRFPLKNLLAQVVGNSPVAAHVGSLAPTASGSVIGQILVWPKVLPKVLPKDGKGIVNTQMVEVESDFVNWRPLAVSVPGIALGGFLGLGTNGQLVFFAQDAGGRTTLATTYVP